MSNPGLDMHGATGAARSEAREPMVFQTVELNTLTALRLLKQHLRVEIDNLCAVLGQCRIDEICRYQATSAWSVRNDYIWIAWNMLSEVLGNDARCYVIASARIETDGKLYRFPLVEVCYCLLVEALRSYIRCVNIRQ